MARDLSLKVYSCSPDQKFSTLHAASNLFLFSRESTTERYHKPIDPTHILISCCSLRYGNIFQSKPGSPKGYLLFCFPTKNIYTFLTSLMRTQAYHSPWTISGEENIWSSLLCSFIQPSASLFLCSNILLYFLLSAILYECVFFLQCGRWSLGVV